MVEPAVGGSVGRVSNLPTVLRNTKNQQKGVQVSGEDESTWKGSGTQLGPVLAAACTSSSILSFWALEAKDQLRKRRCSWDFYVHPGEVDYTGSCDSLWAA
jgi:hypothetical protein